ncbi:MAG: HNH endonuclease [Bacteroidetes bacterium]|nr:HNH endonuclease [Bacteroidota bacterium]
MPRYNWTREQLITALNLYVKMGFTKVHYTNPKVIELAAIIGRSPSAVALKLVNFARLDPELQQRGVSGMSHGSHGEEVVWNEFYHDFQKLAQVGEEIIANFKKMPLEVSAGIPLYDLPRDGREREAIVRQRVNQRFFRDMILGLYKNTCCITGLHNPQLLIAGHITEWSKDELNRLNPANGLCLNLLHDKAFERGLLSIDTNYRIRISSELRARKKDSAIQDYFLRYENQTITLPHSYLPDKVFLDKHYSERFIP